MEGTLRNAGMMISHDGMNWTLTGGDVYLHRRRPAVG
jgi:hypothetical protein